MHGTIDKGSWVPLWAQLRGILEEEIRSGRLPVGAQLASESQLCEEYRVSRTVVRQALLDLSGDGLIRREKGRGSFVAPPKVDDRLAQRLTGLAEEVRARGGRLENRILGFGSQEATGQVAENLELAPHARVVRLDRVRSIDGEPWVVTSTFLPHELCGDLLGLDMSGRSLYETLERQLGFVIDHGRRTIEAALAGTERAGLLDIDPAAPVLLLRSVSYLADNRPIEYFVAWHRADRSRFDVRLAREPSFSDAV